MTERPKSFGTRAMDHLMAMLPSNDKVVYIPYYTYHKRKFETRHYASTFGTKDLSEEELLKFIAPIEEKIIEFQKNYFIIPQWMNWLLCLAIILIIPLLIIHCCKKCCGPKHPGIYETSQSIQDYLKQNEEWLRSRGLSCSFQMQTHVMALAIGRGSNTPIITLPVINVAHHPRHNIVQPGFGTVPKPVTTTPIYGQNSTHIMQGNNMNNYNELNQNSTIENSHLDSRMNAQLVGEERTQSRIQTFGVANV